MHPISVLIIDDEPSVRKAIMAVLKKEDIDAYCAAHAQEAFSLLEKQHFDVVLLDIIMPDEDSFTILKKIRAITRRVNQYAPSTDAFISSFKMGAFTIHLDSQTLYKGERKISLTSREFALLYLFLENPEHVFPKTRYFPEYGRAPTQIITPY